VTSDRTPTRTGALSGTVPGWDGEKEGSEGGHRDQGGKKI